MIESAFVTWLGILILEITSLAPTGHVTVRSHVPQTAGRTEIRWTDEPRCWIHNVGHHTHILRKCDDLRLRPRVLFSHLFLFRASRRAWSRLVWVCQGTQEYRTLMNTNCRNKAASRNGEHDLRRQVLMESSAKQKPWPWNWHPLHTLRNARLTFLTVNIHCTVFTHFLYLAYTTRSVYLISL